MEQDKSRSIIFRLTLVWLAIFLLGSFWLTIRGTSDMVSMSVMPQVPREEEPIIATFKLNNPSTQTLVSRYQFYANGELVKEGATTIAPESSKTYRYAYENPLKLGEQVNFMVKTQSERGVHEKLLSSPPYPPQVWSSFTSFAAFSTSVFSTSVLSSTTTMTSISTMTYYQGHFDNANMGLDVGLIVTVILTVLLIFLELTQPVLQGKTVASLGRLRLRFSTVTWILFLIFLGIVYTKVVMIIVS